MDLTDMIARPPERKDVRVAGTRAPETEEGSAGFRAAMDRETGLQDRKTESSPSRQPLKPQRGAVDGGEPVPSRSEAEERADAGQATGADPATPEAPAGTPDTAQPAAAAPSPETPAAIHEKAGLSVPNTSIGNQARRERRVTVTDTHAPAPLKLQNTTGAPPIRAGTAPSPPTAPATARAAEVQAPMPTGAGADRQTLQHGPVRAEATPAPPAQATLASAESVPTEDAASVPLRAVVRDKKTAPSSSAASAVPSTPSSRAKPDAGAPVLSRPGIPTKTAGSVPAHNGMETGAQRQGVQRASSPSETRVETDSSERSPREANAQKPSAEPEPRPLQAPALKGSASSTPAATGVVSTDATPASLSGQGNAQGPVNSGQAASTPILPTNPAHPASMVERSLLPQLTAAAGTRANGGTVEVLLEPPELGRVEITMELSEQGLRATLSAERQATMDLLRRHLDMLTQQFEDAGFSDVDLEFSAFAENEQEIPRNAGARSDSEGGVAEINAPSRARAASSRLAPDTLVDLRL